jgi:two-component system response regulator YesN
MAQVSLLKVMFVDDEPWVIIGLLNNIPWKTLGFEVVGHYNKSREAKGAILSAKPHIVFVDISMPVLLMMVLISLISSASSRINLIIVLFDNFS